MTPWKDGQTLRAICLDGGGYLGLATAVFLAEMERHFGIRIAERFDLFCGASTGGIIALGLAHGLSAREIVDLYDRLGREVFWNPFPGFRGLRSLRGLVAARYSNTKLRQALDNVFGQATLKDIASRGKFVVVPSFNLTSGAPRVFKTDHSRELSAHNDYRVSDIALATSAAPVYLPIVAIVSPTSGATELYVDGGVYANNPTLLALVEAFSYLKVPASQIQILSISTPRSAKAESGRPLSWFERTRLSRGLVMWGPGLAELFVGSAMQITHSAVNRLLLGGLAGSVGSYTRFELPSQKGLGLDVATKTATQALTRIGSNAAMQNENRTKIAPILTEGNDGKRTEAVRVIS